MKFLIAFLMVQIAGRAATLERNTAEPSSVFSARVNRVLEGTLIEVYLSQSRKAVWIELEGVGHLPPNTVIGRGARNLVHCLLEDGAATLTVDPMPEFVDLFRGDVITARGESITMALVSAGFVWLEFGNHDPSLLRAEQDAKAAKRGIWAISTSAHPSKWVPPVYCSFYKGVLGGAMAEYCRTFVVPVERLYSVPEETAIRGYSCGNHTGA
jgi:endonuclease YncB( thermonuclease family)